MERPTIATSANADVRHRRVGLSREAEIADYEVVHTRELIDDSLTHDPATNAARAFGPGAAGAFLELGSGYARLPGGALYADLDVVGS